MPYIHSLSQLLADPSVYAACDECTRSSQPFLAFTMQPTEEPVWAGTNETFHTTLLVLQAVPSINPVGFFGPSTKIISSAVHYTSALKISSRDKLLSVHH